MEPNLVIIGGSAAGVTAAQTIIEGGHTGGLTVITDEDRLPYKRTKVSKSFAGGFERDAFALHDAQWYQHQNAKLVVGRRVVQMDTSAHTLLFEDGGLLPWDRLVLATGAEARQPPLPDDVAGSVHFAHNIAQVERLHAQARRSKSALVVGMGVLGTETAEQLARMGLSVTLTGDTPAVMSDELNATASAMLADALRGGGVNLVFGETVRMVQRSGHRLQVHFAGSGEKDVDMVVFCVGTRLRTELARQAGLRVDTGVVVDEQLRTSNPDILAAGDVAQHPDGRLTHLWRHALHQGRVVGLNALGAQEPYRFEPFRLKCKIFGSYFFSVFSRGRPDPGACDVLERQSGRQYLCCYYQDGRLAGIVMCNDEPNQKLYNAAVVEGWDRQRVEGIGG